MKLTQTSVGKITLPQGVADKIYFDDDLAGFGLRVRAGGSRKYVVHYRQGNEQRRHTIGPASVFTLEQARQKARKVLVAVDDGRNPAAEKATKHAAASLVLGAVVETYLDKRQTVDSKRFPILRPRTFEETQRYLRTTWKPLHKLPVTAVTRHLVAATLGDIVTENGTVAADRARSALSTFYAWCIGEGMADTNPVIGTNKASADESRERVLGAPELVAIWKNLPPTPFGRVVRLLMLTGQRRNEIGELASSEIMAADDSTKAYIALPGERTKNGLPHDVPLSRAALDVLESQPRIAGRDLVFGTGEGGFSGWSKAKAALDKASGVTGWTLHDLRRTMATGMGDLGVLPHVIEAVINHISGHKAGVAGIYNRSTYAAEKRGALDLWANHIAVLVAQASGANVTKLQRA